MTIPERLLLAADMIETCGLAKNSYRNYQGQVCITYAICNCVPERDALVSALIYMRKFLKVKNLTTWNDDPKRTAEEVISALKEAAAELNGQI